MKPLQRKSAVIKLKITLVDRTCSAIGIKIFIYMHLNSVNSVVMQSGVHENQFFVKVKVIQICQSILRLPMRQMTCCVRNIFMDIWGIQIYFLIFLTMST